MARPHTEHADYFSHDADASADEKIVYLESKFGLVGYAIYFKMLESLTRSARFEMPYSEFHIGVLAHKFRVSIEQLKEILDECQRPELQIFVVENGVIYCPGLKKRMNPLLEKREKRRAYLAAKEGSGGVMTEQNPVMTEQNPSETRVMDEHNPQRKGKERKGKERKGKERKGKNNNIAHDSDFPENQHSKPDASQSGGSGKESPQRKYDPGGDYIDSLIEIFREEYHTAKGIEYQLVNLGKERQALGKIQRIYAERQRARDNPTPANTEQAKTDYRNYFRACMAITDGWLRDNMSPSLLASKHNEIRNILRNNKQKQGVTDAELDEIINRTVATPSSSAAG